MRLRIPPKIRWQVQDVVSQTAEKLLIREARKQSKILVEAMSFQKLDQGRRVARVGDFEFVCLSVFGLESVVIQLAGGLRPKAKKELKTCWCNCQFAEGRVKEVIEAGSSGCLPIISAGYPACAVTAIEDFEGQRYRVSICQCSKVSGEKWKDFICIPTDFEEFVFGNKVVVLYLDAWNPVGCRDSACSVVGRDKSADTVVDALDGQFVILPYEV